MAEWKSLLSSPRNVEHLMNSVGDLCNCGVHLNACIPCSRCENCVRELLREAVLQGVCSIRKFHMCLCKPMNLLQIDRMRSCPLVLEYFHIRDNKVLRRLSVPIHVLAI